MKKISLISLLKDIECMAPKVYFPKDTDEVDSVFAAKEETKHVRGRGPRRGRAKK